MQHEKQTLITLDYFGSCSSCRCGAIAIAHQTPRPNYPAKGKTYPSYHSKQATRTIKVLAGTTQLSLQEDTYQVDGSSVSVTTTLTKLNPNYVVDGQLTTTTTLNSTITLQQFHQQIPHTITLTMDDLVAESYSAVENATTITHSLTILPAHVSAFLDISQEQANTVTNLQVTIVEQNDLVTSFVLTYTSTSGNNVTISYSFTY